MSALLKSELFRLSHRRMAKILLAIAALGVAGLYVLLWASVSAQPENGGESLQESLRIGRVHELGLTLVAQLGAVTVVILAASLIASEYSWGTIRTILPRGAGRMPFLTAKLITLVLFLVVVTLVGSASVFGAAALVTQLGDLDSSLGDNFAVESVLAIGRTALAILPYMALTFFVTVRFRSEGAGIGIGLAVLFLEGAVAALLGAAGGVVRDVANTVFISRGVESLMSAHALNPNPDLPDPWIGALVLTAYSVVFVAIAYWVFKRRDITTG